MGGDRTRWDVTGPELASRGVVVFALDYRSTDGRYLEQDLECGYRYGMSIAEDYGGDLNGPITYVGHSYGATVALIGGLNEAAYGPGGTYNEFFTGVTRPDVIVPINGCHYENEGAQFAFVGPMFSNEDADLVLVHGTDDEICEPWQSRDATEALQDAGYNAKFVEIDGADHFTVIFKDLDDGEVVTIPDEPAGDEVVQTILDSINAAES
jgi:pimeloyl-ACP methyl ester carboxylesterase